MPCSLAELVRRASAPDLAIVLESSGASDADLERLAARLAPTPVRRAIFDADALWLDERRVTLAILDHWGELVEAARLAPRDAPNCGLDPKAREAALLRRSPPEPGADPQPLP